MAARQLISESDRERIRAAVEAAETKTSGEIFTVVAGQSDDYRIVPLLWATLAALLAPLPILLVTYFSDPWTYPGDDGTGWPALSVYLLQLAVFVLLAIVLSLPAVRVHVVPRSYKDDRAHALAVEQFLAHGLHMTEARTGVLIFVSLAERYAEIVADSAIAKKVDQAVWDAAMANLLAEIRAGRLTEGLIAAVGETGAVLAQHFPPRPRDPNELSDDLVLI
jgi:putative membrane protein